MLRRSSTIPGTRPDRSTVTNPSFVSYFTADCSGGGNICLTLSSLAVATFSATSIIHGCALAMFTVRLSIISSAPFFHTSVYTAVPAPLSNVYTSSLHCFKSVPVLFSFMTFKLPCLTTHWLTSSVYPPCGAVTTSVPSTVFTGIFWPLEETVSTPADVFTFHFPRSSAVFGVYVIRSACTLCTGLMSYLYSKSSSWTMLILIIHFSAASDMVSALSHTMRPRILLELEVRVSFPFSESSLPIIRGILFPLFAFCSADNFALPFIKESGTCPFPKVDVPNCLLLAFVNTISTYTPGFSPALASFRAVNHPLAVPFLTLMVSVPVDWS